MSIEEINNQYKKMQSLYGDPTLDSILNGGVSLITLIYV